MTGKNKIKTISASWDAVYFNSTGPELTQQLISADGNTIELTCQYLEPSFSDFPETIRFHHFAPLISRMILVEQGNVLLEFPNGKNVNVQPGEIYLLPSNHPFYTTYCSHCICKGFHLYLRDRMGLIVGAELPDVLVMRCPELTRALQFAIAENSLSTIHAQLMVILVRMLQDQLPELKTLQELPPVCLKIIDHLRKNPSLEYPFTKMSETMGISLSSLSKQFKKHTGQTLQGYRSQLLLEKARRLLDETEMTASEIAASLGFSDVNYFFVFFKKAMLITPLAYRRKSRNSRTMHNV